MTTKDLLIKWAAYVLALLPVWLVDRFLLSSFPIWGVVPCLLPVCAAVVATLEGSVGGAGFSLVVGVLFESYQTGLFPGGMVLLLTLVGLGAGLLSQYGLRQDLLGCLISSALALLVINASRILYRLARSGTALQVLLTVAGRESLVSLCLTPGVYLLFRWVFQRVPKPTVL